MKILIVDDEPGVATGLAEWLTANGWNPPGIAQSVPEALTWAGTNGGVDVLVTEAVVAGADAFGLRDALTALYPQIKTIFISKYDLSAYRERMIGCSLLAKPVSGEALDGAIRAFFDAPKPAPVEEPVSPVATPAPRVVATPKATPVATVSAAAPRAVAQPTARPVVAQAKPAVATPTAAPVAAAKGDAIPGPSLAATPTATPKVAAAAKVVATAKATPAPGAGPRVAAAVAPRVASARPTAVRAEARPQVATTPRPTPVAAATPLPSDDCGEVELPPDELVGTTIGSYEIEARIGAGRQGGIYRAVQTTMGRPVRLYVLDRERANDPDEIQRFIANASVKANVSHPSIFAVYEAGERDGIYFYSCEYIPSRSIRQIAEAGQYIDEATAIQVLKVTAEVLGYFAQQNVVHEPITDNAILLGPNLRPRVANIAAYQASAPVNQAAEMANLGRIVSAVLPVQAQSLGVRNLAVSLATGRVTYPGWSALAAAAVDLQPKVAPQDAYKLDAQERAAIRMVEEARKRQRRGMIISSAVSLSLLAAALGSIYFFVVRQKGAMRNFDVMKDVPAGEFIYQDGEKVTLPTFYIDEYEVTIGQYAKFLEYLGQNPTEAAKFDHPKQPKGKSHVPEGWADMTEVKDMPGYYTRAKKWGKYENFPLDVNSPVFGVDWFDAYAYANWKGRRLPTEQEWEKAARGAKGFQYPWGNEPEPKWANTGSDESPNPKAGGAVDGHKRWSPVDAMSKDRSPFGVSGMAGNVSEWTGTIDPTSKNPIIRGGNWRSKEYHLTRRIADIPDLKTAQQLGFRTASDEPPPAP